MQIILLERIEKLGQMGDLVNVKTGYARNFLIPQGKALRATEGQLHPLRSSNSYGFGTIYLLLSHLVVVSEILHLSWSDLLK